MPPAAPIGPPERPDEEIIEELRERRDYAQKAWEDVREEGRKDVMCVAGDVWAAMDPAGLKQREDAGRPAVSCDEIGQYLNQTGNDVRQNKRGVKVTPTGNGANDKTANFLQGRLRQIEYESNAQRDVYSPIFEDALQRSYGFGRFVSERVSPLSKRMKLRIEAFPNPDVVVVDPDGAMLSPDCSKIQYAFILDASRKRKTFKREFPNAQVVDFDAAEKVAPNWIKGDNITLAEYWLIEQWSRRVVFLKADPDRGFIASKLPMVPRDEEIASEEMIAFPYVCQYLTNGVELLAKPGRPKRTPWPGKSIPIFSCFGKVLYVQTSNGSTERRMLSMVRLMREPVMGLAYSLTCKVETLGGVPRTTWVGYEGQFRGHETEWQKANHEPVAYLVVKPMTEATGNQILPLPERQSWDPPLQNIEMTCESFRRSIQAAAGTSPLPTEAQRQNQKSGKALDRIESSGQKGSFHHVDHLDGMVTRVGAMAIELIPFYDDTIGEVTIRNAQDQPEKAKINDPNDPDAIMLSDDLQHDVTLSVGPAKESERQEASEFADSIVQNPQIAQVVGSQKAAELIALAIRLKDVGAIGDEMADIISPKPPDGAEPPTPQQVAELQAQGQQLQQELQQAQQAIATDQAKQQSQVEIARAKSESDAIAAKEESDLKWRIAQLEAETELEKVRMQEATKLQLAEYELRQKEIQAEIDARQQALGVRQQAETLAHEATQAEQDRAHESEEARAAREQGADLAMQQAEHAQAIAPPEQVEA